MQESFLKMQSDLPPRTTMNWHPEIGTFVKDGLTIIGITMLIAILVVYPAASIATALLTLFGLRA